MDDYSGLSLNPKKVFLILCQIFGFYWVFSLLQIRYCLQKNHVGNIPKIIAKTEPNGIVDSWVADPYKHLLEKEYGILIDETIAGKTLQATHFGAYEMSAVTHNKIYEFADANEISLSDLPYEFYTNDPTLVAPEDVETLIVYEIIN